MIITDDFVMLNFPKTGSSFAWEALKKSNCDGTTLQDRILERDRLLFTIFPGYLPANACARPW